jgi:hypothetical protein
VAKKKSVDYTNIVAEINPVYLYTAFDKVGGLFDGTSEGNYQFDYMGWNFNITISAQAVSGYASTRKNWELTGLYEGEVALVPVAANVQASEPPLLASKDAGDKYMRVAELWTTRALTRNEAASCVNYAQPTPPGFPGGDIVDAYMDTEQLISGRYTTYCGNANFDSELGFMSIAHQSILGEGEPAASPDLHYIKAVWFQTNLNAGTAGFTWDMPASRDILTVAKVDMTGDVNAWTAQVIRGSNLDAIR